MARRDGEKKEDALEVVGVVVLIMAALILMIWLMGSWRIVNATSQALYGVAHIWKLVPLVDSADLLVQLHAKGSRFLTDPRKVGFFEYVSYLSVCIRPLLWLTALGGLGFTVYASTRKRVDLKRKFVPHDLAVYMSHVFTGTAPILHLRKDLALDKDKFWRRQVFPHEVLLNHKVEGKPIVVDNKMDVDRARQYFLGIEREKNAQGKWVDKLYGDRKHSRMMGRQVVSLLSDRGKKVAFADRMTPAGKVIFALLCAHAFGGEEGKKDYGKARDQLNNSARGAAHGFANLAVAQWLFDKYRLNPMARKLFAIHHWEHTYLWELLIQAKKQGKCGHWEWIWLKPMSRIMFYALNTVGRQTPHTESAAAFNMYLFERRVAKAGRLPLMRTEDGGYVHSIFIEKAVRGLSTEWDRWLEGDTSQDDDWWKRADLWEKLESINLDPPPPPPAHLELGGDTDFDIDQRAQREAALAKVKAEEDAAVAAFVAQDSTDLFSMN